MGPSPTSKSVYDPNNTQNRSNADHRYPSRHRHSRSEGGRSANPQDPIEPIPMAQPVSRGNRGGRGSRGRGARNSPANPRNSRPQPHPDDQEIVQEELAHVEEEAVQADEADNSRRVANEESAVDDDEVDQAVEQEADDENVEIVEGEHGNESNGEDEEQEEEEEEEQSEVEAAVNAVVASDEEQEEDDAARDRLRQMFPPPASQQDVAEIRKQQREHERNMKAVSEMMTKMTAALGALTSSQQTQSKSLSDVLTEMARQSLEMERAREQRRLAENEALRAELLQKQQDREQEIRMEKERLKEELEARERSLLEQAQREKHAMSEELKNILKENVKAAKELIVSTRADESGKKAKGSADYVKKMLGGTVDAEIDEEGEKALKRHLAIDPKVGFDKVPTLSNDLLDLVPWKSAADLWIKASRFYLLNKMDIEAIGTCKSPYVQSKNSELYALIQQRLNPHLKLKIMRDAKDNGVKAWKIIEEHFNENRTGMEYRYHDEFKSIPDLSTVNDIPQLLLSLEKKLRLNDELGAMDFCQHRKYESLSVEIFQDLKQSVIPDVRLFVTVEEAGALANGKSLAKDGWELTRKLRTFLGHTTKKGGKKKMKEQFATELDNKEKDQRNGNHKERRKGPVKIPAKACLKCWMWGHRINECRVGQLPADKMQALREKNKSKWPPMEPREKSKPNEEPKQNNEEKLMKEQGCTFAVQYSSNKSLNEEDTKSSTIEILWDSCAAVHTCNRPDVIHDLTESDIWIKGYVGEEATKSEGKGILFIGEYPLTNVELIPGAKETLISTTLAKQEGWNIDLMKLTATSPTGEAFEIDDSSGKPRTILECNSTTARTTLWHQRLNHANKEIIAKTAKCTSGIIGDIDVPELCDACIRGKARRKKYNKNKPEKARENVKPEAKQEDSPEEQRKRNLEMFQILEMDFSGPWKTAMLPDGHRYVCAAVTRGSSTSVIVGQHAKGGDHAVSTLEDYLIVAPERPKTVKTDPGTEFDNKVFRDKVKEIGAEYKPAPKGESNQLAKVEATLRELYRAARSMLSQAHLPEEFGLYAMKAANYIRNRMAIGELERTPYEMQYGKEPTLNHIRVFGCVAYVKDPGEKLQKFAPRAYPVIFVGYDNTDQYVFWNPVTKAEIRRRDAWFHEDRPGGSLLNRQYVNVMSTTNADPQSRGEAMSRNDWPLWRSAEEQEYANLSEHDTWELVPDIPQDRQAIKAVFKYKTKYNKDNTIDKRKARLVAHGFRQKYGVDFKKTFAPTPFLVTFRIFLLVCALLGLFISTADVSGAFLYSELDEEIYLQLPNGKYAKLKKSIYGLRQAAHNWFKLKSDTLMKEVGFQISQFDECLYFLKQQDQLKALMTSHVDDSATGTVDQEEAKRILQSLEKSFKMSDTTGKSLFVGINSEYRKDWNGVHMGAYIDRTLEEHQMSEAAPVEALPSKLLQPGEVPEYDKEYMSIVGKVAWIANTTRPDIAFTANMLQRAMNKPTSAHVSTAKRTLRYLKGTANFGLRYQQNDVSRLKIEAYVDAAFGDRNDGHSTGAFVILANEVPLSWRVSGLNYIATSSTEAEIGALQLVLEEIGFIRGILNELLGDIIKEPIKVYCDNAPAVELVNHDSSPGRTRTINTKLAKVRRFVMDNIIEVTWIPTEENLADVFTKPLTKQKFLKHARKLVSKVE